MDPISYGVAAKQKQRIEKVIAEPDSTSGVITVPQVIASGENITVPAGRVAVLPNVQVDGTLNVQGDVFIPSGATLSGVVEKVTSTDNAVVRFNGVTGEVQNSGVIIDDNNNVGIGVGNPSSSLTVKDGITLVRQFNNATARPDVTPGVQKYGVHVGTDNSDDGFLRLSAGGGTNAYAKSYIDLSGYSTVPDMNMNIVFGTYGSEKMRITSSGNLLVGTTTDNGVDKLQVNGSISASPPYFGIQQQVNNHRKLYCFYTGNFNQNRLKLTISGNPTYLSFVLNIVYSNLYSASNQSAIREYSFKRLAYANTTNFSEIGTGLGSTVTVISSNIVTGGYEVVLGFNAGGYPQFDIEIINHQEHSTGTITGEFLTV